jgi:X-X-X-Leu-X-X-Gly heptad repeat protein
VDEELPTITEGLQTAADAAKRLASGSVDAVRDTASDFIDQGRAKAQEVSESMGTHVREQPGKSVLIAAGVGFLIGMLFARR